MSIAALPRVSGRHRNKALAGARRARVLELRAQGWTYDAIARELGYTSRATVHHIFKAALAAQQTEDVQEFRAPETARLDALQAAVWDRAMAGDVAAISQARRIIEARVRLFGLTREHGEEEASACATVVCSCRQGTGHRTGERPL